MSSLPAEGRPSPQQQRQVRTGVSALHLHLALPAQRHQQQQSPQGSPPATGAQTAPAGGGGGVKRRCPRCKHSAVSRWKQWPEHGGEMIWHCHYVSKRRPACEYMWRDSRPLARCDQCGLALDIEQHNGIIGYWCGMCQDFSQ